MRFIFTFGITYLLVTPTSVADVIYNANEAFVQSELAGGSPVFGPFSIGHHDEALPGGFTAFTAGQHTTNFYNPAIHGFYHDNGFDIPAVVVNTNTVSSVTTSYGATLDPSQILLHPGGLGIQGDELPFHNAILRFTAPTSSEYQIQGDWEALAPFKPNHTVNSILINGASVFSSALNTSSFDLTQTLTAGDFVDFVVNDNGDIFNDSIGLRATLTASTAAVPEPSTFGLLAIGGIVAGVRIRRRRSAQAAAASRSSRSKCEAV
ncbi:MAG: PEP-CTERM sorting domain-containing protein [Planctomycetaceae bacterium]|nr:PEP-CTERM sorting domain-containing protein [Planctomycetaceae bacterium]